MAQRRRRRPGRQIGGTGPPPAPDAVVVREASTLLRLAYDLELRAKSEIEQLAHDTSRDADVFRDRNTLARESLDLLAYRLLNVVQGATKATLSEAFGPEAYRWAQAASVRFIRSKSKDARIRTGNRISNEQAKRAVRRHAGGPDMDIIDFSILEIELLLDGLVVADEWKMPSFDPDPPKERIQKAIYVRFREPIRIADLVPPDVLADAAAHKERSLQQQPSSIDPEALGRRLITSVMIQPFRTDEPQVTASLATPTLEFNGTEDLPPAVAHLVVAWLREYRVVAYVSASSTEPRQSDPTSQQFPSGVRVVERRLPQPVQRAARALEQTDHELVVPHEFEALAALPLDAANVDILRSHHSVDISDDELASLLTLLDEPGVGLFRLRVQPPYRQTRTKGLNLANFEEGQTRRVSTQVHRTGVPSRGLEGLNARDVFAGRKIDDGTYEVLRVFRHDPEIARSIKDLERQDRGTER
jgi:hypothetical protein